MDKSYALTDFNTRLNLFIKSNYATRKEFCDAIEVSENTVNSFFGTRKSKPSFDFFNAFLEVHSPADLFWLIKGVRPDSGDEGETFVSFQQVDPYEALNAAIKAVVRKEVEASVSVSKKGGESA